MPAISPSQAMPAISPTQAIPAISPSQAMPAISPTQAIPAISPSQAMPVSGGGAQPMLPTSTFIAVRVLDPIQSTIPAPAPRQTPPSVAGTLDSILPLTAPNQSEKLATEFAFPDAKSSYGDVTPFQVS